MRLPKGEASSDSLMRLPKGDAWGAIGNCENFDLFSDVKPSSECASVPKGATPLLGAPLPKGEATQTHIHNTLVVNEGCNFGEMTSNVHNETKIAVDNVIIYAESEHEKRMSVALDQLNRKHALETEDLQRRNSAVYAEAAITQHALADYTNENQQLRLALEIQKNERIQDQNRAQAEQERMASAASV
jgi:hypothetical protein